MCPSAKAIDEYASLKTKAAEGSSESAEIDPRLEAIVERMLDKYVKINLHVSKNSYVVLCLHIVFSYPFLQMYR